MQKLATHNYMKIDLSKAENYWYNILLTRLLKHSGECIEYVTYIFISIIFFKGSGGLVVKVSVSQPRIMRSNPNRVKTIFHQYGLVPGSGLERN
jgi:hypothetical protein